jgi:hypothetical protein
MTNPDKFLTRADLTQTFTWAGHIRLWYDAEGYNRFRNSITAHNL